MKTHLLISPFLIVAFFILTSMTTADINHIPSPTQHSFNDFFRKRSLVISSISELEIQFKKGFNFFEKIKINLAKRKFAKQLKKDRQDGCDTIKLITGEILTAFVSEVTHSEINYKKCDDKTGPTYTLKKSAISMISYANRSTEYFGNKNPAGVRNYGIVNSGIARTDPLAVASLASLVMGIVGVLTAAPILSILVPVGIVFGFISKNRIKKSKGKLKGRGLALAAIIGGFITVALVATVVTIVISSYAGG